MNTGRLALALLVAPFGALALTADAQHNAAATPTVTATGTGNRTSSGSITASPSATRSGSGTPTQSRSASRTHSNTPSRSPSRSSVATYFSLDHPNMPQRVRSASLGYSSTTSGSSSGRRLASSSLRSISDSSDAGQVLRSFSFCLLNGIEAGNPAAASGLAVAFHEIAVSALGRGSEILAIEPPADAPINADSEPLDCGSLSLGSVGHGDAANPLVVTYAVTVHSPEGVDTSGDAAAAQLFYARVHLLWEAALAVAQQGALSNTSELAVDPPLHTVRALASGALSVQDYDASLNGGAGSNDAGSDSRGRNDAGLESDSRGSTIGFAVGIPLGVAVAAVAIVVAVVVMRRSKWGDAAAAAPAAGTGTAMTAPAYAGHSHAAITAASASSEAVLATGTSVLSPRSAAMMTRARHDHTHWQPRAVADAEGGGAAGWHMGVAAVSALAAAAHHDTASVDSEPNDPSEKTAPVSMSAGTAAASAEVRSPPAAAGSARSRTFDAPEA